MKFHDEMNRLEAGSKKGVIATKIGKIKLKIIYVVVTDVILMFPVFQRKMKMTYHKHNSSERRAFYYQQ